MTDLPLHDNLFATPDRFLWHHPSATAILSDLHLGAEAELTRRGILMPEVAKVPLQKAWQKIADRLAASPAAGRVVIAGDLFDVDLPDASTIAEARALLHALPAKTQVTLVPGNHDPAPETLATIFAGLPVTIASSTTIGGPRGEGGDTEGGYTVIHGHDGQAASEIRAGLITGHQHPAVILRNRVQETKMICYATCRIKARKLEAGSGRQVGDQWVPLVVLPAFSRAPLGSNLLSERNWILDLPRPADEDLRILGLVESPRRESRVLDFGTLAGLRLPF